MLYSVSSAQANAPLASSCGNPATKLESGDPVFTRQAYIDLSDVPAKVSVNATVEGEITRAMLGSRIVVSTDKLGYRDGVLTLDTSVLYDDAGELAISSGEQTLRLYTSDGTVDIEILLVNKVLRTAQDILDLNDYIEVVRNNRPEVVKVLEEPFRVVFEAEGGFIEATPHGDDVEFALYIEAEYLENEVEVIEDEE